MTTLTHCRIDEDKARLAREDMIRKKVIYGHSVPYRNMCRFQSGVSVRVNSCADICSISSGIRCSRNMITTGG